MPSSVILVIRVESSVVLAVLFLCTKMTVVHSQSNMYCSTQQCRASTSGVTTVPATHEARKGLEALIANPPNCDIMITN